MPYPPSRPRQIVPWSAVPVGGRPRALPSRAHSHSMRRSQAQDGLLAIRCRGCCCKLAGEPCYWMISLRVSSFRECYYYSEYLQKLLNYKKKGILFFLLLWFTTSRHPSQTRRTVRACDALPLPAWLLQFTVSPGSPNPCLSYSTTVLTVNTYFIRHAKRLTVKSRRRIYFRLGSASEGNRNDCRPGCTVARVATYYCSNKKGQATANAFSACSLV